MKIRLCRTCGKAREFRSCHEDGIEAKAGATYCVWCGMIVEPEWLSFSPLADRDQGR